MRKTFFYLLLVSMGFTLPMSCKKKSDNTNTNNNTTINSAFADSLHNSCTHPFVGTGDSSNVYLPTAFTPNGDGINDFYRVIGVSLNFSSFLLTVYDTTGNLVFGTNSASVPWEGTDTATGKLSTKYKFYVKVKYTTTGNKSDSAGTFVFLLSTSTSGCINIVAADSSSYEFGDQFNPATGFNASFPSNETFCN